MPTRKWFWRFTLIRSVVAFGFLMGDVLILTLFNVPEAADIALPITLIVVVMMLLGYLLGVWRKRDPQIRGVFFGLQAGICLWISYEAWQRGITGVTIIAMSMAVSFCMGVLLSFTQSEH